MLQADIMNTAKQYYELAFHINTNLDEADIQKTRQDLENIITSHRGVVLFAREPKKIWLAYPIKHNTNALFGYLHFNLESPESTNQIRDELKLNPNVLRFIIIKQEVESKPRRGDFIRKLAITEKRRAKALKDEKSNEAKVESPKMGEKAEKELEEKLEKIIEKL